MWYMYVHYSVHDYNWLTKHFVLINFILVTFVLLAKGQWPCHVAMFETKTSTTVGDMGE